MESFLLNGTVVAIGLVALGLAFVLFRRPASDAWVLKLVWFLLFPLLYQVGYALVLMGLGLDRWDDASDWYWDTWLGFGSAALLAIAFAATRFRGASRVVFALLGSGWVLAPAWLFLRG